MMMDERIPVPDRVLAEGEVTGHAHRLTRSDVYERGDTREFDAPVGDTLTHEEHGPITLPPGSWASGRVVEYDHLREESRAVED
jgi:hypothetical protein